MKYQLNQYIPYGKQSISAEDIEAVVETLKSQYLTQGPAVPNFENKVAEKVGAKYAIAVNSATSALHISCIALGLQKGDWLWTTPTTFVASANCGLYCGASIDFVDIDPRSGLMSIDGLEEKLEQANRNNCLPKIVVPVHLTGASCDMEKIGRLAKEYNFKVIEDGSHAIGAKYRDQNVGCCEYSDICVFSFHPVKIITTGEGGIATTNDGELSTKLQELRTHGITKDRSKFSRKDSGPWAYEQQSLGFNYRMTDIQAALGISQLQKLDGFVRARNNLLRNYQRLLSGSRVKILEVPERSVSSVHLAVLVIDDLSKEQHKNLFIKMQKEGIGVQLHYEPVHLQPYYQAMGFSSGDFPYAEKYAMGAMSIPMFPDLKYEQQSFIIEKVLDCIEE